jgi:hypothetical protein
LCSRRARASQQRCKAVDVHLNRGAGEPYQCRAARASLQPLLDAAVDAASCHCRCCGLLSWWQAQAPCGSEYPSTQTMAIIFNITLNISMEAATAAAGRAAPTRVTDTAGPPCTPPCTSSTAGPSTPFGGIVGSDAEPGELTTNMDRVVDLAMEREAIAQVGASTTGTRSTTPVAPAAWQPTTPPRTGPTVPLPAGAVIVNINYCA